MSPTSAGVFSRSPLVVRVAVGLWLGLAAFGFEPLLAAPNELGHPIVRNFPPGRSGIAHLCQALAQDADGFIYLANSNTLRLYDGATWRIIPTPTESAGIRKFAVTADGAVFAAGAGVIGYFRGAGENKTFVSLAGRLPPSELGCEELHDVVALGNTVYFADEEKILMWRDGKFSAIPCRTPARSRGARLHRVGDTVYVTALGRALGRLVGERWELVADDPVWRENQIVAVEAGAGARGAGVGLTLLTAERGFFQLAADGRVTPLATEANRWLADKTILRAQRLGDGSLAVAFTAVSGEGGLRFSAEGVYLGPIDNSIGLYVKTLRNFLCDREGGLWLGTETGLFRLEWPSGVTVFDGFNGLGLGAVADVVRHEGVLYAATSEGVFRLLASDDIDGRAARFEQVASAPAYSLLSHPAGLLVVGYAEVSVHTPAGLVALAKLPPGGGTFHRSNGEPDRVGIATTDGVRTVRHTPAGWREETGAPAGPGRDGGEPPRLPHLVLAAAGTVAKWWEESDRGVPVLWVCGSSGLVRVEVARAFPPVVPFATLLQTMGLPEGYRLPAEHAAVTFGYVALRHQIAGGVSYQTRLVGGEDEWSEWAAKRERTFSHLPAGDYRFEVRARDADGHLATPASFAFSVLAPWWRTRWALLGYASLAAGLIAGLVRLRTRALRQRAARLEDIVADRTAELAEKNIELVRLNRLELDGKISARLGEEKARLEVLRYQLNPHFLFNTLASISAALPAGTSTPRTMVERLAEFCRLTLHRPEGRDWTTLGEEVQLLRSYLEIEQSRWGALLDVEIACDPALDDERLPHFLLLPLVENALKYGRATSADRVGLRLAARRGTHGALVLTVANTGEWIEPAAKKTVSTLGIGLENLRERLARHYPSAHQLEFSHADGWVTASLRLTLAVPASTTS